MLRVRVLGRSSDLGATLCEYTVRPVFDLKSLGTSVLDFTSTLRILFETSYSQEPKRPRPEGLARDTAAQPPLPPPLSAQEASPGLGCGGETISMFEITPLEKRLFLSIEEIPRTVLSARPFSFLVRFSPDRTGEVLHLTSE